MLAFVGVVAFAMVLAADVNAQSNTRPTQAERRCLASKRRVERQMEAIAQAEARTAKERAARAACKTRRACDNLDRALNASDARRARHEKHLAQLTADADRDCALTRGTSEAARPSTTNPR